jgi:hypothetical protein
MRYQKPEVVVLGSALGFVQAVNKPKHGLGDIPRQNPTMTPNAYEADE